MSKRVFSLSSFIGGLALGIVLAAAWFLGSPAVSEPVPDVFSAAATGTPGVASSSALSVNAQNAGATVLIDSVTVPPPGVWVAVRDVSGDTLGNVLGAALASGPRLNLVVPLLRETQPATRYAVELYRADGDGQFNVASDSVYVDFGTGERVVQYFTTAK